MNVILATNQKHFADAFRIRTTVFIGEQSVPVQEEIDDYDCFVPIFIAYEDEKALGTARVIIKNKDIAKIGRVAVLKEARKKGFGKNLMLEAMSYIKGQTTAKEIQLDAQLTAVKFYESLGCKKVYETIVENKEIEQLGNGYTEKAFIYEKKL